PRLPGTLSLPLPQRGPRGPRHDVALGHRSNRRHQHDPLGAPPIARQWQTISPREQIRRRYCPDMRLTTDEGKSVRLYEDLIEGKIVLLNFMYARCRGVCIPVTSNLLRVQKLLGDRVGRDIFMYSFTLDPLQD